MRLFSPVRGLFDPLSPRQLTQFLARFGVSDSQATGDAAVVKRVYEARPDLREAFPLALTPQQREAFAAWLFGHGRCDLGITDGEIVAYLKAAAKDRSHGLAETWLLTPAWQEQYPNALTKAGWSSFKLAIANQFQISQRWIRQAMLPKHHTQQHSPLGVNLLAHFRYPSGLQEEALQYAAAIREQGGTVSMRDAPLGLSRHPSNENLLGAEVHGITLAKLGACESLDDQYPLCGWHPRRGVYRIACWSWELETLPRHLAGAATLADEIWTPSTFCAGAVKVAFPEKTVTSMLPAVVVPPIRPLPRTHFGLPAEHFLFHFSFDIGSVMERKNPLGLIRAFQNAFAGNEKVHLAIKVTRGSTRPESLAKLKAAADHRVTIIDQVMPREEVMALMCAADAYVSLHRAEGFGFTVAEAMLMGKPVIATGYSANAEFMTPQTAYAVNYKLVNIGEGCSPYPPDAKWAEPDLDHAASLMRRVFAQRDQAKRTGDAAKRELPKLLSIQAAGARMMQRLQTIRLENPILKE